MKNVQEYLELCCSHFPILPSKWSPKQRQCISGAFEDVKYIFTDPNRHDCGKYADLIWITKDSSCDGGKLEVLFDRKNQIQLFKLPFEIRDLHC